MELIAQDDYFVHHSPQPLSASPSQASSDPRFFERHWNVWHDDVGELLLALGGSWYPNLGRLEAYAIINHQGIQRSVRVAGPAISGSDLMSTPPISSRIETGLQKWHHRVEDGDWDFSFDLTWHDTHRHVYAASWGPEVESGERQVTAGFEGFGEVTGLIEVGDTRVVWEPGQAHGTRDRHWGIGRGVGGPALNGGRAHRPGWKGGIWIDLGDVGLWGKRLLYPFGDDRPGAGAVLEVNRRLRFEPDTQIFTDGVIDLTFDDGQQRQLHLERLGHQTAYMRCAFYGGTPDSQLHHGEYDGPGMLEWDSFDLHDASVRRRLSGLNEHHCRVSVGEWSTTGILQPVEPDAYIACLEGRPGWQLLES